MGDSNTVRLMRGKLRREECEFEIYKELKGIWTKITGIGDKGSSKAR